MSTNSSSGSATLLGTIAPAVVGAVLALLVSFGLVYTQTSAPSSNPAQKPVLTYGTN